MAENTEAKTNLLTYEGHKNLENELEYLKNVKREENKQKIKEAREQGDLSENAEYDAAKDEQRDIETRIKEIEDILKNCEIIVEDESNKNIISIGSSIKVCIMSTGMEMDLSIVGATEANSLEGKISNESPLGQALLGARKNQVITVEAPGGEMQYKVLKIEKK